MGIEREPDYLLPQVDRRAVSNGIVAHWRRRWLAARIDRDETIREVARHSLTFPVEHGARVVSLGATDQDDDQLEFDVEDETFQ